MKSDTGKWGFQSVKSGVIDLDRSSTDLYSQLLKKVPGLPACLFCGSCSSTCTSSAAGMNFRQVHLLILRGEPQKVPELIRSCLLCGKCTLVCPRDVDTRSAVYNLRILLYESH